MIINIQNISHTSQLSPEFMSEVARTGDYTKHLDTDYFFNSKKNALLTAVVICDKAVRGVCVCIKSLIPDSCEIDSICIKDDFRRKGLGRKLLAHSLRNMRNLKIKTAYVWINENDKVALKFFGGFGFEPDGKRRASQSGLTGEEIRCRIDIY